MTDYKTVLKREILDFIQNADEQTDIGIPNKYCYNIHF